MIIDYVNRPAKRTTQKLVMNGISVKNVSVTCLAGHDPKPYINIINECMKPTGIRLCDTDWEISKNNPGVIWGKLEDIVRKNPTNMVDCDYCASILTEGSNLKEVYDILNSRVQGPKVLMFSFSTRFKDGLQRTLKELNRILYDGTLEVNNYRRVVVENKIRNASYCHILRHTQSKFKESVICKYSDYTPMICGAISWE